MGRWGEKTKCSCVVCNKEILVRPYEMRIKNYCSPECKKASRMIVCSSCGNQIDKDQARRYMEKNYCSEECKKKATLNCTCDYCGRVYHAGHVNKNKNYCSQRCKEEGKKAEAEARENCTCDYCGKRFEKKRKKNAIKKYCSRECLYKGIEKDKQERKIIAVCLYCGKTFEGKSWQPNHFCSNRCCGIYYADKKWEERRKEIEAERQKKEMIAELKQGIKELKARQKELKRIKTCKCCGKVFKSSYRIYCSDACVRRTERLKRDKRIYKNGKPDLSINLFKLYKRDSGVCQLCGKLTNFTADIQSDAYPSIDHILPISKGGKHEWNNVQLAHRGCNSLKSDTYTGGQGVI